MHSTKNGNQYSFGMKIHVVVDRESKTDHSLVTTPNVHDSRVVEKLLHGKENAVLGDSAYMEKTEEIRMKDPRALDLTQTSGTRNKKLTEKDKEANRLLSKTRSRGEHVFLQVNNINSKFRKWMLGSIAARALRLDEPPMLIYRERGAKR